MVVYGQFLSRSELDSISGAAILKILLVVLFSPSRLHKHNEPGEIK